MEVNIKGEWIPYTYFIYGHAYHKDYWTKQLEKRFEVVKYLGKSKAIRINGEIKHLRERAIFFLLK